MSVPLISALGLVAMTVVVVLFWAFAGLLVQAGCRLVRVPVPGIYRAVGAVLVIGILNSLIHALARAVVTGGTPESLAAILLINAILLPIDFIIAGVVYSSLLQAVTFGKGMLIYLIQWLIGAVIGVPWCWR